MFRREFDDDLLPDDDHDEYAPPPRTWFTDLLDRLIGLIYLPLAVIRLPLTFAAFVFDQLAVARERHRLRMAAVVRPSESDEEVLHGGGHDE